MAAAEGALTMASALKIIKAVDVGWQQAPLRDETVKDWAQSLCEWGRTRAVSEADGMAAVAALKRDETFRPSYAQLTETIGDLRGQRIEWERNVLDAAEMIAKGEVVGDAIGEVSDGRGGRRFQAHEWAPLPGGFYAQFPGRFT